MEIIIMTRSLSAAGLEQLILEEGEVLRAYQDVKGVWTIGVGLTAASGVIKPVKGMVISRQESRALLARAIDRNYAPAVAKAMPLASQTEFDGALSFHFNTGAIATARWVQAWLRGDKVGVRSGLAAWRKSGGKVVPGLITRRAREADLILFGRYDPRVTAKPDVIAAESPTVLRLGMVDDDDVRDLQAGLKRLGFYKGAVDGDFGPKTEAAVIDFQRVKGLTVDGLAGKATRAAIGI
jgi:lysozyme